MKITKLTLKNYQQLEDLELDFTYPSDHPKSGQPLEKVCFIGPNGAGKNVIMEGLINGLNRLEQTNYILPKPENENLSQKFKIDTDDTFIPDSINIYYFPDDKFQNKNTNYKPIEFDHSGLLGFKKYLNFGVKVISDKNKLDLIKIAKFLEDKYDEESRKFKRGGGKEPPDYLVELFQWFDKQIDDLNFELSVYSNIRNQLEFRLKDKTSSTIITLDDLSSGTRQLMYKLLPLYFEKDNLNKTFLFIDQPEDALFPDLQKKIVDIYTGLGQNNQYFFATHSPLIAGQFEPYEIFPLGIKDGKTYLKQKPIGSSGWSSDKILYHWFGTSSDSNIYSNLKQEFYNLLDKENKTDVDTQKLVELRENPILSELFN